MADLEMAREHPEKQLWDELEDVQAGMLGVVGSGQHMQPMAPQLDPAEKSIWFFTKKDTDLARAVGSGSRAHFCVLGKNHDYHACIGGTLQENKDPAKIDEFWSSMASAWFEGGRDDPDMTLLQFRLEDASVWASSTNPISFGWEIAKANLGSGEPDVGVRNEIVFTLPPGRHAAAHG